MKVNESNHSPENGTRHFAVIEAYAKLSAIQTVAKSNRPTTTFLEKKKHNFSSQTNPFEE